jgi:hypothetical protein
MPWRAAHAFAHFTCAGVYSASFERGTSTTCVWHPAEDEHDDPQTGHRHFFFGLTASMMVAAALGCGWPVTAAILSAVVSAAT